MGRNTERANIILCVSILIACGWLGINLYANQDLTMPLLMAANMIVLGLGLGYVIGRRQ